jgi:hypothetical protein
LVGTVDRELVADTEPVIAGFAAACSTGGGGLSTPAEVVGFLRDYEDVSGERLSGRRAERARAPLRLQLASGPRTSAAGESGAAV